MSVRAAAAVLIAAFLAACATTPPAPLERASAAAHTRAQALLALKGWTLDARVGVRSASNSGQLSMHWRHRGEVDALRLVGPFGRPLIEVRQDLTGARLRLKGRVYRAADAQALLRRLTGVELPLAGLPYWVIGVPVPGVSGERGFDDAGRLRRLTQLGWEVEIPEYETVDGVAMPASLRLRALSPTPVTVRLQVEGWQLYR